MLTVYRDATGHIEFAAECQVVDVDGKLAPLDGAYVFVEQVEANPEADIRRHCRQLIADMATLHPHARFAYWIRRDRTGKVQHGPYTRYTLTRWAYRQPTLKEVTV